MGLRSCWASERLSSAAAFAAAASSTDWFDSSNCATLMVSVVAAVVRMQWPRKAAAGAAGGDGLAPSADASQFMEQVLRINASTIVSDCYVSMAGAWLLVPACTHAGSWDMCCMHCLVGDHLTLTIQLGSGHSLQALQSARSCCCKLHTCGSAGHLVTRTQQHRSQ